MHGEQKTLDVGVENLVEVLFGDCAERGEFSRASIGEENVYAAFLLLYDRVYRSRSARFETSPCTAVTLNNCNFSFQLTHQVLLFDSPSTCNG